MHLEITMRQVKCYKYINCSWQCITFILYERNLLRFQNRLLEI